jgi:hypothetical protein
MRGALLVLAGVACTPGAADEALPAGDPAETPDPDAGDAWTAASTSGVEVTLSVDPLPLRPGPIRLEIALGQEPPAALPLSLDLVSPEMPMHGIVRYETESSSASRYQAVVEIPMEGLWELYVNLDYGADAAVFELDVPAPEGSTGHEHHGGAPSAEEGGEHGHEHPGETVPSDAVAVDGHHGPSSPENHAGTTAPSKSAGPDAHAGHDPR